MPKLSNHEKIKILKAKGLSAKDIANVMSMSDVATRNIIKQYEYDKRQLETFNNNKVDILRDLQRRVIASISDEDLQKLNAYQKTTMIGILIDKERLISGQSTSNQAVLFHLVEQACKSTGQEPGE